MNALTSYSICNFFLSTNRNSQNHFQDLLDFFVVWLINKKFNKIIECIEAIIPDTSDIKLMYALAFITLINYYLDIYFYVCSVIVYWVVQFVNVNVNYALIAPLKKKFNVRYATYNLFSKLVFNFQDCKSFLCSRLKYFGLILILSLHNKTKFKSSRWENMRYKAPNRGGYIVLDRVNLECVA